MSTLTTTSAHKLITPAIIGRALPGTTPQEQDIAFRELIEDLGSYEAAKSFYEDRIREYETMPGALGDPLPPPGRTLQTEDIGHLKLFYHTFLPDLPQWKNSLVLYSFYIGLHGKGPKSIMPNLKEKGIEGSGRRSLFLRFHHAQKFESRI